jgi:hypothetical protein
MISSEVGNPCYVAKICLTLIIAIFSFALGVVLSRKVSPPPVAPPASEAKTSIARPIPLGGDTQLVASLREENQSLRGDLQKVNQLRESTQDEIRAAVIADRIKLLETFPQTFSITPFSEDLKVTPEMQAALGMTSDEVAQVQQLLAKARSQLDVLDARNLVISEQTSEKTAFEIKPYKEGKKIGQDLNASINTVLGDQRGKLFLDKSAAMFDTEFSNFGSNTTTQVEILWNVDGQNRIKRSYVSTGGGSMSSTVPFQKLPSRYQNILELKEP